MFRVRGVGATKCLGGDSRKGLGVRVFGRVTKTSEN